MKKIVVFVCILAMCASLAACGGKGNESQDSPAQGSGDSQSDQQDSSGEDSVQTGGPDLEAGTWSTEMEAVKQAVVSALGDNYFPNSMVDPELLEGLFGISADLYDDYYAEMPMISTNVDTILVIKPKSGKAADVEAALTAYQEAKKADTMQYPQNLGKIQASVVKTVGSYLCFVQLGGDVMDILDSGDEAVISHCQEQNQTALDAISALAK